MPEPEGGCLIAQLASVRHAAVLRRVRVFTRVWLMELRNEPVHLGRDADEDLADDMDHLAVLGVNRASTSRACEL